MQDLQRHRFCLITLCLVALAGCTTASEPNHDRGRRPVAQATAGVHVVQRGDTLFSISWQQGLDYQKVAGWNGIAPPYTIYPGQKIRLYAPNRAASAVAAPIPPLQPVTPPTGSAKGIDSSAVAVPWQWPANGPILRRFDGQASGKKGISIGGTHGNQIRAATAGKVVYAGSGLIGYGRLIILKHNETYLSAYGHNRELLVQEGDEVRAGQVIANMGSSGTNRIQLHFEIRRNGKPVDPLRYLPRH